MALLTCALLFHSLQPRPGRRTVRRRPRHHLRCRGPRRSVRVPGVGCSKRLRPQHQIPLDPVVEVPRVHRVDRVDGHKRPHWVERRHRRCGRRRPDARLLRGHDPVERVPVRGRRGVQIPVDPEAIPGARLKALLLGRRGLECVVVLVVVGSMRLLMRRVGRLVAVAVAAVATVGREGEENVLLFVGVVDDGADARRFAAVKRALLVLDHGDAVRGVHVKSVKSKMVTK